MDKIKIGILGGAFNPFHKDHSNIIKSAIKNLNLDLFLLIPSNNPPHKKILIKNKHRKDLIKISINKINKSIKNKIKIDYFEFKKKETCYAIDTIKYLEKKYLNADFYYCIGYDSFLNLDKWKDYKDLIKKINLVVFKREHFDKEKAELLKNKYISEGASFIKIMDDILFNYSSTKIRLDYMLNCKKNLGLSRDTFEYIKKNKVYPNYKKINYDLKKMVTPTRYQHTHRVVEFACFLNAKHNLNLKENDVVLAALLHDISKSSNVIIKFLNKNPILIQTDKNINLAYKDNKITPVLHAFVGAKIAEINYNIKNKDILNAIKYHTTGRKNMSALEKLIYSSDMLEQGRDFLNVQDLREIIYFNFELGFKNCLKMSFENLKRKTNNIFYLTEEAYKYYCEDNND